MPDDVFKKLPKFGRINFVTSKTLVPNYENQGCEASPTKPFSLENALIHPFYYYTNFYTRGQFNKRLMSVFHRSTHIFYEDS